MIGVWFAAVFLCVIVKGEKSLMAQWLKETRGTVVKGSEICYARLGCFEKGPPWSRTPERPVLGFPEPPDVVNTAFHLYTRENPEYFQEISAITPSTIRISNFRTNRRTRFIVHGYIGDDYDWLIQICRLLLQKEDINCIVVNWKDGAANPYIQAVQNTRVVGAEIAYLLEYLEKSCGYFPSNVHIIGHSLGAHAGGEAGRRKRGLSRITGLDPAGPLFHDTPAEVRLDPSDAKFVDVIHTNKGRLFFDFASGIIQPCGHLDFYPNGGERMPGCKEKHLVPKHWDINRVMKEFASSRSAGCSHKRSLQYYSYSIFIPDGFLGYRCDAFDSFLSGMCFPCPDKGCPMMGHYADTFPDKTKEIHQTFYLITEASPPFASWREHISINLLGSQKGRGNIIIALAGTNNVRREYLIFTGFIYPRYSYEAFLDVNIPGNITAVEFQLEKHPAWQGIDCMGAQQVTIVYGNNGQQSVFCGSNTVQPNVWQKLTPC